MEALPTFQWRSTLQINVWLTVGSPEDHTSSKGCHCTQSGQIILSQTKLQPVAQRHKHQSGGPERLQRTIDTLKVNTVLV